MSHAVATQCSLQLDRILLLGKKKSDFQVGQAKDGGTPVASDNG